MTTVNSIRLSEETGNEALAEVIDPEFGLNIVDLGRIHSVEITHNDRFSIVITLTTPGRSRRPCNPGNRKKRYSMAA